MRPDSRPAGNDVRRILTLGRRAALATLAAPFVAARAQTAFPSRPIRIVSPYPPGGGTDTTARLLAVPLARLLGQPIVVENKAGASGSIGASEVARAAPDGHTLLIDPMAHVVNPTLMRGLTFDYGRAFAPVSQVTRLPQVMIAPVTLPPTLAGFIAQARANEGKLAYGSSGNATGQHLAAAMFLRAAGLRDIEHVPFRGGSAAMQGVLAGDVAFAIATVNTAAGLVREGRLRGYAVASERRIAALPEVPTFAEAGVPGVVLDEWNGVFVPTGTPGPVIERLYAALAEALRDPTVQARMAAIGAQPVGSSPAEFAAFIVRERESLAELIRAAHITLEG
ncbi:MAG: tripartite tricarboxylate transporter substrate binding protein [Reyranellaceae bacterium]